jgi:tRNA A37 N6-isopentenylltransferase MiaA
MRAKTEKRKKEEEAMTKKRIVMIVLALTLVLGMTATAFAVTTASDLSEAQKNELYALQEQRFKLDQQMIDKYLELDLITEDQATLMKERMNDRTERMLNNGFVPGIGGGFGGKGIGFGGGYGGGRMHSNCINGVPAI